MLLLAALTYAADSSPSLYLPGAAPLEAGTIQVGGGLGFYSYYFADGGDGALIPFVAVEAAPIEGLVIYGSLMTFSDLENTPILSPTRPTAAIAARYNALQTERISLAPWLAMQLGSPVFGDRSGSSFDLALGLAMEGGSESIRWDLSLPVFWVDAAQGAYGCGDLNGAAALCELGAIEGGVSFRIKEAWSVRVGKGPTTALAIGARMDQPKWYVEATLLAPILLGMGLRTEAGLRF